MELIDSPKSIQNKEVTPLIKEKDYQNVTDYFNVAGPDYEAWSKNFNMHFGYCRSFADIFSLEKMLVNMNEEVIKGLQIDPQINSTIADLGCGAGTVARFVAKKFPLAKITGFTIADYQVEKGRSLNQEEGLSDRVEIIKDNFETLDIKDESFTHAYALESACYSSGAGKNRFVAEMARVLKSGGRFSIADGFLKHNRKLPGIFSFFYKKILKYWALPCFGNIKEFEEQLKKQGLKDITIREISLRIAPSVSYVPWTCIKFFAKEIWKNKSLKMKKERWHNVYAPVIGMILGLYRRHFGYYLISGRK
jgi:MPBQ/MSBQ methyltransferase